MSTVIFRRINRQPPDVISQLGKCGVATVHEAQGRTGLMRPCIRPIYPTACAAGSAVTVLCHPGDNLMIHAAIEVCEPGDVLVVTTTSESTDGMFGELLATSARAHGVAALIIDAGVRDVAELTAMSFPVWSKAISAQGTAKAVAGAVNIDIVCAGTVVRAGDVVVADPDGVAVVESMRASDIVTRSLQRIEKEARTRERLAAGELGLDIHGLRAKLKELGVEYVEHHPDTLAAAKLH